MKVLVENKLGTEKPELLADDFQFRFPIVELDKPKFIKAFGGFQVDRAFPDFINEYYGFRMDPKIPGRIWVDTIGEGTHTGQFGGVFSYVKPTNKKIVLPPQVLCLMFFHLLSFLTDSELLACPATHHSSHFSPSVSPDIEYDLQ